MPDWEAAKAEMNQLWDRRNFGEGEAAFAEIEANLKTMSVGGRFCNYCEHNLISSRSIEHIRPKSTFPAYAFRWENMLKVCPQCNMESKIAKMWIFCPEGSNTLEPTTRRQPPTEDICFINPRIEDAMELMELDFLSFQFFCNRNFAVGSREFLKVEKTIEILNLGSDDLAAQREAAFLDFKNCLAIYCQAMAAQDIQDLRLALGGYPDVHEAQDFLTKKSQILAHLKASFFHKMHQTVWREMQRRYTELSLEVQLLFEKSGASQWLPTPNHPL
ncbi:MAG: hypothetical protein U0176_03135 [Bacteroidia bacterium]